MHYRNNFMFFAILTVCFCVVFGRNIENTRQKRTSENSCDSVKQFFEVRNIKAHPYDSPKGNICTGQCCGPEEETALRKQGQKDFATMLRHNSRSLQGLLNSTATTLQSHVTELARQSENKTLLLFSQVYRRMSVLSRDPINTLYTDIRTYVQINSSQDAFANTNIDIISSVTRFFTDMFPLVYHHVVGTLSKDFAFEYKSCLKRTINEVQPFGDIPRQVAQSLSKSLDASRLLLQAFSVGVEVLNATDTLIIEDDSKSNAECHDALMKMTYCPKCIGLGDAAKPCSGYCLNVLRGCLTKYVAELDSPWNGYVEGIERLVTAMKQHNNEAGVNVDAVIRGLDTRISEAIMRAMEKQQDIDTKVKRACGSFQLSDKEDPSVVDTDTSMESGISTKPRMGAKAFLPPPETQMVHFLNSIAKSRGFYGNLAESLCQDESFAEPKDQHCWNGERVGEYTKTVVDSGLDMQKYNPEVKPSSSLQNVDTRVANLADKLRHVHQMVMSSLGAIGLESDNYMQGDGVDGSGSGDGPGYNNNDDDDDVGVGGSGSGHGPSYGTPGRNSENNYPIPNNPVEDVNTNEIHDKVSGATNIYPSVQLSLVLILTTIILRNA